MTHQATMEEKVEAFNTAMEQFIRTLEAAPDAAPAPKDGWSPAQIGWHVARTNELLSDALLGAVPMAQPIPPEFQEDPEIFARVPAKIQTFPQLEPPADVTRDAAIVQLRASLNATVNAFRTLSEERARRHIIQFPMGPLSMYQFADFTVDHVSRHQKQLERCLE